MQSSTSDPAVALNSPFVTHASEWWDEQGAFKMLHRLSPLRIAYIRQQLSGNKNAEQPLKGMKILDVGCGGGLLTEAMAKAGAAVVALDASEPAIRAAQAHATQSGLKIDYRVGTIEEVDKQNFDCVTAFEIIEHIEKKGAFLNRLSLCLKPGGLLMMATVNRTVPSFLFGVLAAEYLMKWVPKGAHDWDDFVKPSELKRLVEGAGLELIDLTGVTYNPFSGGFAFNPHQLGINYLATAQKA